MLRFWDAAVIFRWLSRVFSHLFLMAVTGQCVAVAPVPMATHGFELLANGQIAGWGNNEFAQVQAGQAAFVAAPLRLSLPGRKFVSVSRGGRHSLAIDDAGKIWAWGDNSSGQLGLGHTRPVAGLSTVAGLSGRALQVVAGAQHSAALMAGGTVWVWGANHQGQTGTGVVDAFAVQTEPLRLAALGGMLVVDLASGDDFVLALVKSVPHTAAGKRDKATAKAVVWTWGAGQAAPRSMDVIQDATLVRAAGNVAMARTATGGYWRWRADQAPAMAQRQAFESLGKMTHPLLAALNAQIKTEMRLNLAADVSAYAAASKLSRSGAVNPVVAMNNAITSSAMPAKPAVLTQQNTAPTSPTSPPQTIETVRSAIPVPLAAAVPALPPVPDAAAVSAPVAAAAPVATAALVVLAKVTLSGRVRLSSGFGGDAALENVQVSAEGAQCSATDNQGRFNCVAPAGWSGRVSLRRNNYRFAPSSLSFQNLRTNADGQDFAAFYDPR